MKLALCVALLVSGYAQAGELLPMSGKQSTHMQEAIDKYLRPAVLEVDGITVEPILEEIMIAGRGKRFFLGPAAGDSNVRLRIKITSGAETVEQTFYESGGSWKGIFRPGQDYKLVNSAAIKAASFVRDYSRLTNK